MPLLNYTTKVNSQKTVTEVMALLVAKGAYQVDSASERIKLGPAGQGWRIVLPGPSAHGPRSHANAQIRAVSHYLGGTLFLRLVVCFAAALDTRPSMTRIQYYPTTSSLIASLAQPSTCL